jgi:predicted nuclease of predicted toxin-antitoxin system
LRLLVDQNLPHRLAGDLAEHGWDAVHTEDVGLQTAPDPLILRWCCAEHRCLLSADKKLTKYLASSGAECPSVVIIRDVLPPELMARALLPNLTSVSEAMRTHGNAVFSFSMGRPIRAEILPLTTRP